MLHVTPEFLAEVEDKAAGVPHAKVALPWRRTPSGGARAQAGPLNFRVELSEVSRGRFEALVGNRALCDAEGQVVFFTSLRAAALALEATVSKLARWLEANTMVWSISWRECPTCTTAHVSIEGPHRPDEQVELAQCPVCLAVACRKLSDEEIEERGLPHPGDVIEGAGQGDGEEG